MAGRTARAIAPAKPREKKVIFVEKLLLGGDSVLCIGGALDTLFFREKSRAASRRHGEKMNHPLRDRSERAVPVKGGLSARAYHGAEKPGGKTGDDVSGALPGRSGVLPG
jgi:hypothetical protein